MAQMPRLRSFCCVLLLCAAIAQPTPGAEPLAPGYGKLGYALPEPGTYTLPPIRPAADAAIVDSDGKPLRLRALTTGKVSLLTFMFTQCSDVNGCPLTSFVFYQIKQAMQRDAELAKHLRLISVSFDPARDTPEQLRWYAANFKHGAQAGEWRFVTVESEAALKPLLEGYDQDVQRRYSVGGAASGDYSHILRVFLIDAAGQIRNIYSVAFLQADLVLSDVRTLLRETTVPTAASSTGGVEATAGAGDFKHGYESAGYATRSLSLAARRGEPADLLALAGKAPLGLPAVPVPPENPLTAEKIALGRKLFFDRRLSLNNTFSCAMCHIPEQGFTSQELQTAVGIEGRTVRRNAPTLYNVAYMQRLFHDGRESTLEQQIWGPLLARNEMGAPSVGYVIEKIRALPDYHGLFERAFGGRGVGMETLGQALASYQRTLVSGASPFDRWLFGKQSDALGEPAKRGYVLFTGKAGCVACHRIEADHALFTDQQLHNTGTGYRRSMHREPDKRRVLVAPGVYIDVDTSAIKAVSEPPPSDLGLYEITEKPADRWKFRTPGLRNVALTAPYMHDGSLPSLRAVVEFYDRGGEPNEGLSPLIKPLGLTDEEKADVVAFLESLTGDNVATLVADAFAAPVGDVQ